MSLTAPSSNGKVKKVFDEAFGGNDGFVSQAELLRVLKAVTPVTDDSFKRMLTSSGCLQNDGRVNYSAFLSWLDTGNSTNSSGANCNDNLQQLLGMPKLTPMDAEYLREHNVANLMEGLYSRMLKMKPIDIERFCADYFSGALADQKRLVLVSSDAGDVPTLLDAVKPYGDMGAEIVSAVWDFESDPKELLDLLTTLHSEHGTFKTVAICGHGEKKEDEEDGEVTRKWLLTRNHGVDVRNNITDEGVNEVIRTIANMTSVRIDLLACKLAKSQEGREYIARWEAETKTNFAASIDVTGNPAQGGNWVLETDGIQVDEVYFDKDKILTWGQLLKRKRHHKHHHHHHHHDEQSTESNLSAAQREIEYEKKTATDRETEAGVLLKMGAGRSRSCYSGEYEKELPFHEQQIRSLCMSIIERRWPFRKPMKLQSFKLLRWDLAPSSENPCPWEFQYEYTAGAQGHQGQGKWQNFFRVNDGMKECHMKRGHNRHAPFIAYEDDDYSPGDVEVWVKGGMRQCPRL